MMFSYEESGLLGSWYPIAAVPSGGLSFSGLQDARRIQMMKAAVLAAYGEPLEIREVLSPEPGPGEVLVRVTGVGVCHSDLTVVSGRSNILERLPAVLGHEIAGQVVGLGRGVTGLREGEAVAVFGA